MQAATICPRPLQVELLTLKVVSRVTWATSVPILVFLCLSVLDLGPMYATDVRQTSDAHHRLMPRYAEDYHNTTRTVVQQRRDQLHGFYHVVGRQEGHPARRKSSANNSHCSFSGRRPCGAA